MLLVNPTYLTIAVLSCLNLALLLCVVIPWLWRKDDKEEERRKGYADVAAWAKEMKAPHVAEIFRCAAADDWSGVYNGVRDVIAHLKDEKGRLRLLDENFEYQLLLRARMPEWLEKMKAAVQSQEMATLVAKEKAAG